jgi:hypothetical protein
MKPLLSLAATSTTVLGLMATGVMGSTTALAAGFNSVTCMNDYDGVQCGQSISIDIDDIAPLSSSLLRTLQNEINDWLFQQQLCCFPWPPFPQDIADQVVSFLEQPPFYIHTCTVVVPGTPVQGTAHCR